MAHPQPDKRRYTVEEYLALEEVAEVRHEFYQGEIFAMTGASLPHNRLIKNSVRAIEDRINPDTCEAFIDGALVEISADCYLYPDVVISCHDEDLASDHILRHPHRSLSKSFRQKPPTMTAPANCSCTSGCPRCSITC